MKRASWEGRSRTEGAVPWWDLAHETDEGLNGRRAAKRKKLEAGRGRAVEARRGNRRGRPTKFCSEERYVSEWYGVMKQEKELLKVASTFGTSRGLWAQ